MVFFLILGAEQYLFVAPHKVISGA